MTERQETPSSFGQAPAVAARPPRYPAELEQILTLRDGRPLFVRPVIPADELAFEREWREADPETLYQRFFTPQPKLDARRLHALLHVDYQWRLALVAFTEDGRAVGIARYEGAPGQEHAEIAFVVNPVWRRLGLASALLSLLAEAARARGIRRLVALYLEDNQAMAALLTKAGFGSPQANAGVAAAEKML
jgi:acetyltransferase